MLCITLHAGGWRANGKFYLRCLHFKGFAPKVREVKTSIEDTVYKFHENSKDYGYVVLLVQMPENLCIYLSSLLISVTGAAKPCRSLVGQRQGPRKRLALDRTLAAASMRMQGAVSQCLATVCLPMSLSFFCGPARLSLSFSPFFCR